MSTMKLRDTDIDKKHCAFIDTLNKIHNELANLLEDPLFLDSIHGEQEASLDLTLELIETIIYRMTPAQPEPDVNLLAQLEMSAVDIT
jgi:hypothetical protein